MSSSLQVVTFNIRYGLANDGLDRWELRRPRALAQIEALKPDLMGLQEALEGPLNQILERFPRYGFIGVGREDGERGGEFAPILYDRDRLTPTESGTFWFSDTPDVPGSTHWGNYLCRICTWARFEDQKTGRAFRHYNLHIDHESAPSRLRSVRYLLERIAATGEGEPSIVTGDFNVHETGDPIVAMKAGGFRDSYREAHPDAEDVGTFSAFEESFGPEKIDYIFVDSAFEVENAEIVRTRFDGRWPSDHAAVTATLRLIV